MAFHKFNHFTGRLKQCYRLLPLYPIRPIPLQSSEPPQIIFDTIKTKAVKTAPTIKDSSTASIASTYSTAPTQKTTYTIDDLISKKLPLHKKNYEFMKKLQSDLEAPVYLAKGTPDKILFGITVALIAVGMFESLRFIYRRATGKI